MAKKSKKNSKKGRAATTAKKKIQKVSVLKRVAALAVIGIVLLISLPFSSQINEFLHLYQERGTEFSGLKRDEVIDYGDSDTQLLVHFIDVGQGDATLIEFPDGKTLLIDGGKDKEKTKLLEYLNAVDLRSDSFNKVSDGGSGFDYVILTHADEDHCGGLDDAINEFGAAKFYRPNELATYKNYQDPGKNDLHSGYTSQSTLAYSRAITAGYTADEVIINRSGLAISSSEEKTSQDYYELIFYGPLSTTYSDRNDYSPIMILYFKGKKIALSGDAEQKAEGEFYTAACEGVGIFEPLKDKDFYVDVIKAGHHGSRTSTGEGYLSIMTKQNTAPNTLIVISCGLNNSYKHPHDELFKRLTRIGVQTHNILRTDLNSTIVIKVHTIKDEDDVYKNVITVGADNSAMVPTIAINEVVIDWHKVALAIFISAALILIVEPLTRKSKAKSKRK